MNKWNRHPQRLAAAVLATLALAAVPALAQTVSFDGSMFRAGPGPQPGLRCAPALTVVVDPVAGGGAGYSGFGSFFVHATGCLVPPLPADVYDGEFRFEFAAGDTLRGTWTAAMTFSAVPDVLDVVGQYLITGGSGRFDGASGAFVDVGTVDRRTPGVGIHWSSFNGSVTLVPEPASAALLLCGGALLGAVVRRRNPFLQRSTR